MKTSVDGTPKVSIASLAAVTAFLLCVQLWLDGHIELMFDEAYYALWSKHLAWCYLDHPPMVALWIRLSTICFGEHEFGVRALGTLAAAAGAGLVYILSWHLFASRTEAAYAGLLYCSMLLISAGAIIITPDTPLVFFWSIALYGLVRVFCDDDARWWWLIGIAMGFALQSKYTTFLLGAGIACSMVVVPRMRRWWRHPMPYLAGALAIAIFFPVILWNYHHGWASFGKQFDRTHFQRLSLRYVAELIGSQIGLLTPFVFCLALGGVWLTFRQRADRESDAQLFLVALIGPMLVYFLVHSLHARVHGNWVAPAYPVLALLGARAAFQIGKFSERLQAPMAIARRIAVPVGVGFAMLIYLQVWAAPFPVDPAKDPTALMAGWSDLADQIRRIAQREHARYILTSGYALTSLLNVYRPDAISVIQFNERLRWIAFERPNPSLFFSPGLYIAEKDKDFSSELAPRFLKFDRIGEVARRRDSKIIKQYVIYRFEKPVLPVLDAVGAEPARSNSRR